MFTSVFRRLYFVNSEDGDNYEFESINHNNVKDHQQSNQVESTINSKIEENKSITNFVSKSNEEQKVSSQATNYRNNPVANVKKILINRRKYQAS